MRHYLSSEAMKRIGKEKIQEYITPTEKKMKGRRKYVNSEDSGMLAFGILVAIVIGVFSALNHRFYLTGGCIVYLVPTIIYLIAEHRIKPTEEEFDVYSMGLGKGIITRALEACDLKSSDCISGLPPFAFWGYIDVPRTGFEPSSYNDSLYVYENPERYYYKVLYPCDYAYFNPLFKKSCYGKSYIDKSQDNPIKRTLIVRHTVVMITKNDKLYVYREEYLTGHVPSRQNITWMHDIKCIPLTALVSAKGFDKVIGKTPIRDDGQGEFDFSYLKNQFNPNEGFVKAADPIFDYSVVKIDFEYFNKYISEHILKHY